jgi:hypothetical protein
MNYYQRYLRKLRLGTRMNPRGAQTTARFNESFIFEPGTCWRRPHDNPSIGLIEGLQFIAGMEDKEAIKAAAPSVDIDLFGPTSFYGPRCDGQFVRVINELRTDVMSRRAVVMIAHPMDTSQTMPCTLSMHFYVDPISARLHCTVTARSNDAVWGMPYDMIQYGMVHIAVASCLDMRIGETTVNITNAHVYDDHNGGSQWDLNAFVVPKFDSWRKYVDWAKSIVEFRPTAAELRNIFALRAISLI